MSKMRSQLTTMLDSSPWLLESGQKSAEFQLNFSTFTLRSLNLNKIWQSLTCSSISKYSEMRL